MTEDNEFKPPAMPRWMYDKLVEAEVGQLSIDFNGGGDEGFIEVDTDRDPDIDDDLKNEIVDWAEDNCEFGGGDGNDHRLSFLYNIEDKTVTYQECYMDWVDGDDRHGGFMVAEEDDQ